MHQHCVYAEGTLVRHGSHQEDEILLVLRLWAREIKKPKGKKRQRSSLYQDAMDIAPWSASASRGTG